MVKKEKRLVSDLLSIADLDAEALRRDPRSCPSGADLGAPLAGKGVALVFQKPSARTRNSTEMAAVQLGAHPVYIQKEEVGLGTRESAEDVARTLACYHAIIAARVIDHRDLRGDGGGGRDAGAQPALRHRPSAAGARRPADRQAIARPARRARGSPMSATPTTMSPARWRRPASLVGAELTLASPEAYALDDAPYGVRHVVDPAEAVAGARDRLYRRLGVDGPGRGGRGAARGVRAPIRSTRR